MPLKASSLPLAVLFDSAIRLGARQLLIGLVFGLFLFLFIYFFYSSINFAVPVSVLFALLLFAGPLAASSLRSRRSITVFSRASLIAGLFSFVWAAFFVAAFILFLHFTQGAEARPIEYVLGCSGVGLIAFFLSFLPEL